MTKHGRILRKAIKKETHTFAESGRCKSDLVSLYGITCCWAEVGPGDLQTSLPTLAILQYGSATPLPWLSLSKSTKQYSEITAALGLDLYMLLLTGWLCLPCDTPASKSTSLHPAGEGSKVSYLITHLSYVFRNIFLKNK